MITNMNEGRLKNSIRNVFGALINKATAIIFPFIIRTIILYYLGTEYAGLSSLFTSVLQILSLSELGIGSAIVFSMYKPIAEGNNAEINALLKLYRKFYCIIGMVILLVGITLIPLIPRLINGTYPHDVNLYALYLIYLSNTVISYFLFAYKASILNAFQRSDIESNLKTLINTGMYILQIITLIIFKNYYIYIIWLPIATIFINVIRSFIVNKQYPKIHCAGEVSQEVKQDIFKRVGALIGHQLSGTINCSLDNIVVSAFLGLKVVAQYGNYYYVVSALSGVMQVTFNALTASIGNSLIKESKEKNLSDFYDLQYINNWIVGWMCITMLCIYQDFMKLWAGDNLLLTFDIVILFVIYFYSWQIRRTVLTYKNACGMWWADKVKPYASVVTNLILNFSLVQVCGIYGVMLSTIVCYVFIEAPWETHALFKEYFKQGTEKYWKSQLMYILLIIALMIVTFGTCECIKINGILSVLVKGVICAILPNVLWILCTFKSNRFKRVQIVVKKIVKRTNN